MAIGVSAAEARALKRQAEAEENQTRVLKNRAQPAEVVETKTITLVRTTYKLSRVDAKSLEALLKKIVKADVLQI